VLRKRSYTLSAPVRLVHLAGYGGPYPGSFIPMLRAVMRAGRGRGWRCEAVFGPTAQGRTWLEELRADGVPFRIAGPAGGGRPAHLPTELLRESDEPTILHSHFTTFDTACVRAARRRPDTAVFWHVHSPHGDSLALRARHRIKYGLIGRQVESIMCVSAELAEVVVRRGAPRERVVEVPNAIDADRFSPPSEAQRRRAREALGLPTDRRVLVHFGWDWHRKGGDLFCAALAGLRDEGRDVLGVTAGATRAAAEAAQARGLPPDALRPLEPREDVRLFYAAADVFIAPSRAEGTPYSVLEAVSCGTGVVASDIPGHREIAGHVSGCLVVALAGAELARGAAALLDRSEARVAEDARAGHEWVRRERDLSAWTAALFARYDAALARAAQ
jgi:glycosyltransferase involved in cell wall biosynthesis